MFIIKQGVCMLLSNILNNFGNNSFKLYSLYQADTITISLSNNFHISNSNNITWCCLGSSCYHDNVISKTWPSLISFHLWIPSLNKTFISVARCYGNGDSLWSCSKIQASHRNLETITISVSWKLTFRAYCSSCSRQLGWETVNQ